MQTDKRFKKKEALLRSFQNGFFLFIQLLSTPVLSFLGRFILRVRLRYPHDFSLPKGLLIIANHQSTLDPFLITYYLGWRNFPNVLPVHYPTADDIINGESFLYKMGIPLFAGFSIGGTSFDKAKKMIYMRALLKNGTSMLLFPEGKRVFEGDAVGTFHQGMHLFLKEDIPILLVRISGMNTWSFFDFKKRYQAAITYSEVLVGVSPKEKQALIKEFFQKNDVA